jgi:molecular chaperone GrpE
MAKTSKEGTKSNGPEVVNEQEEMAKKEDQTTENQDNSTSSNGEGDIAGLLAQKEVELTEQRADFLRLMAEFDNFRKRTQREKAALVEYAATDTLTALLPVLDDFERTISVMDQSDNLASIKEGVSMVHNKFLKILTGQGLALIEAKGLDFNSEYHEAIASISAGEEQVGKVIEEVEKGYRLKEKVIRYSKVIVGE